MGPPLFFMPRLLRARPADRLFVPLSHLLCDQCRHNREPFVFRHRVAQRSRQIDAARLVRPDVDQIDMPPAFLQPIDAIQMNERLGTLRHTDCNFVAVRVAAGCPACTRQLAEVDSRVVNINPNRNLGMIFDVNTRRNHIEGYTYTERNGGSEYFALRVEGNSMNAMRIFDGDILIVRRQDIVENEEIAVVMVGDDAATVKRFYQSGNSVTLCPQSTDSSLLLQKYALSETRIRVLGKVVKNKKFF